MKILIILILMLINSGCTVVISLRADKPNILSNEALVKISEKTNYQENKFSDTSSQINSERIDEIEID